MALSYILFRPHAGDWIIKDSFSEEGCYFRKHLIRLGPAGDK